jgi:nucleoside phosphorylase
MMIIVQICSNEEWDVTKCHLSPMEIYSYPYGEFFSMKINDDEDCIFYHSGETKTLSAGACQYAIDKWSPDIIFVLGTCGGVAEKVKKLDVIVVEQTAQYDIIPMKKRQSIFHDIISLDLSWVDFHNIPHPVFRGFMATADQSVTSSNYRILREENAIAADWETAAIAKICYLNDINCCVLRGVSDVPDEMGQTDTELQYEDYKHNTSIIMQRLISSYLPLFISQFKISLVNQSSVV